MIAVIYSGSRYAFWKLAEKGEIIADFKTSGINPFFNDEKYIFQLLNKNTNLINHAEEIKRIYFFGAGASTKERKQIICDALSSFFKFGKVYVEHDMLAAAIASCQDQPGIVCIIASGSNAVYYDGKKVKENNYGLGYILGDEGSANWLGIQLLNVFLNDALPKNIHDRFIARFELDRKLILDKVYKQPHANHFLSSFIDFLLELKSEKFVKDLIDKGFSTFIELFLLPVMQEHPNLPVHFVGSVAANFEHELKETASKYNITIQSVIKEPIYNLLNYYANKN